MSFSRRRFLEVSSAALAAPAARALPGSRRTSALEQRGVGVIGMGIRARNLLRGFLLREERVRILAVCDVDRTRREAAKARVDESAGNGDCRAVLDHRALLDLPGIDAVVIATPDHWHATQCIQAAQAGKDVYCEKPLTHTLEESRRIIEAVHQRDVVFQTGSQQRTEYGQRFVRAVELVRNGHIGRLLTVHVGVGDPPRACDLPGEEPEPGLDWNRWLGPTPERPYHSELSPRGVHDHYPQWRRYWDFCNGGLADMGAHHFDIAQWALEADRGGPVEVLPAPDGNPKRGARLRYANGVEVIHGGPGGCTFLGTRGSISVDRGRISSVPAGILEEELDDDAWRAPRKASHVADWLDAVESRQQPICDVEVGARTAAVNQLLVWAYRSQQRIAWDPLEWAFREGTGDSAWMDYARRPEFALPPA